MLAIAAILCITVAAGAAGAINMWYDRDIDAIMRRTAKRPIPAGPDRAGRGAGFGVALAVGSVIVMGLATNMVAAAILALSIALLRVRLHDVAEAPHAAEHRHRRRGRRVSAGDRLGGGDRRSSTLMPVLMFRSCSSGRRRISGRCRCSRAAITQRAGVPMLPVVAGARETRRQIMLYTLLLVPLTLLAVGVAADGAVYGLCRRGARGRLPRAVRGAVWRDRQDAAA